METPHTLPDGGDNLAQVTEEVPRSHIHHNGYNTVWTPTLEARLRELAEDGLSGGQIAAAMGMSRNAIMGKLLRLGIKLKSARGEGARTPRPRKPRDRIVRPVKLVEPVIDRRAIHTEPPEMGLVTLMELEPWHCRYICDDGGRTLYCGNVRTDKSGEWCSFHRPLIFHQSGSSRPWTRFNLRRSNGTVKALYILAGIEEAA